MLASSIVFVSAVSSSAQAPPDPALTPSGDSAEQKNEPDRAAFRQWLERRVGGLDGPSGERERGVSVAIGGIVPGSGFAGGVGYKHLNAFPRGIGFQLDGRVSHRRYLEFAAAIGFLNDRSSSVELDTADRREPSETLKTKTDRLKEKIAKLKEQMQNLKKLRVQMLAAADQQISLTDPDARSMATSGRGSGVVGYNVQVAVETKHHLIITHEVTNVGTDRSQLSRVAQAAKATLQTETLDAVADRGYFSGEEVLACENAGITVSLPKPMTSNSKTKGRFGKQDFRYVADEDVYICPAKERLPYRYTNQENGLTLRRYWTNACQSCAIKRTCTTSKQRRITRWEHEHVLEAVQRGLDEHPEKMRQRRETVEHPFGTIKARMGATHFLMKTLPWVASEMALHVLAYNFTRVMNIMGIQPLMAAIRAT